jgi:hypothetical protein
VNAPERPDETATRHLCFAVCLQIAARETAGLELDPAVIANHLGVVLPVGSDSSALVERGVTAIRFDGDPNLWGITPAIPALNAFLKQATGFLGCSFESISTFQDWEFENRLTELTESGRFPIVGFDYNSLLGDADQAGPGHCGVAYRVRQSTRSVIEIYDPGPDRAGFKTVDAFSLYRACRRKHGGIWLLSHSQQPVQRRTP